MVDRRNMPVEDLIRSQLQSEEEFTDQVHVPNFRWCGVRVGRQGWGDNSIQFINIGRATKVLKNGDENRGGGGGGWKGE